MMRQVNLDDKPLIGNTDLQLFELTFTRVTELLTDPFDTRAAAAMFIEELTEHFGVCEPVIVIHVKPVFPGDEKREEIDYEMIVLMSPGLAMGIDLNTGIDIEPLAQGEAA